ncbi:MAG: serine/threonine protein kinase [Deltaproteobacteria bacterium]|nr:serine/threonine protein kinase [Deltaproteobacteria bacterium]
MAGKLDEPVALEDVPLEDGPTPRYTFVREIARGGVGRVYTAVDTQLSREVAIKELHTRSALSKRRFEREALLTARLEHPGIVSVHEYGRAENGEPYLVMRNVRGQPFDQVIAQQLTLGKRLALLPAFVSVAEAVAYAHEHNVVHRDLKPSNLLLGEFGDAVVIDWGLAKDLGGKSDDGVEEPTSDERTQATLTRDGAVMGTPVYMSPEQARGAVVDERTDVYALGAVLYHLLAGVRPYPGATWKGVLEDVLRGPPRPLSEQMPQLAPELVAIVERAMEREPERRYRTAKELAEELKAFLAGRLVRAHAYSTRELLVRSIKKHRAVLTVAAVSVLALAAGAIVSVQSIVRERREALAQRDRANLEAETSRRVSQFLSTMFKVSNPSEARGNRVTAREVLDRGASEIETTLKGEPKLLARLSSTMADVYMNLGLRARARALYLRAQSAGEGASELDDRLRIRARLALLDAQEGRPGPAEQELRTVLATTRELHGAESEEALDLEGTLAGMRQDAGKYDEALLLWREILASRERVWGPGAPETLRARSGLAQTLLHLGRHEEAEKILRDAWAAQTQTLGADHPATLSTLADLVSTLESEGRREEAMRLSEKLTQTSERVLGPLHPDTLSRMTMLANLRMEDGQPEQALLLLRKISDQSRALLGPDHPQTLLAEYSIGITLEEEGKYDEERRVLADVLARQERVVGPEHPDTLATKTAMAVATLRAGNEAGAEKLQKEVLEADKRVFGEVHPETALSIYNLAGMTLARGDRARALELLREAVDHGLQRGDLIGIASDQDLRALHGDAGFEGIVADAKAKAGR